MEKANAAQLAAYLARIGIDRPVASNAAALAAIQFAHRCAIPFENLDIRLGRGIAIDSASVFDKLVTRGRGGYCFEQNRLFADMLDALGFQLRMLLARVLLGPPGDLPPFTHCLLLVELDGKPWIADAGFGGSYAPPMPLEDGTEAQSHDGARHRLRRIGEEGALPGSWLLERLGPPALIAMPGHVPDEWQRQYAFNLSEVAQADLELGNHFTATHPTSRFCNVHVASRTSAEGFIGLTEERFVRRGPEGAEIRTVETPQEYAALLRDELCCDMGEDEAAGLPLFAGAS